jgi:UPF0716 family protein affecting phage T7 exclusion/8-oxo-dGTP pyrophosphatase MutT (NUDIX family)
VALVAILVLVAIPVAEIYVIIQVAHAIGAVPAVLALLLISAAGPGLVRRQGLGVWSRARDRVRNGQIPGRELMDGVLLLCSGVLITVPGFITDGLGLLLLLPPVRALARRLAIGRLARRSGGLTMTVRSWPPDPSSAPLPRPAIDAPSRGPAEGQPADGQPAEAAADAADAALMPAHSPGPSVRDAATVMLVRDGPGGMEVFMLRRNLNSDFVGGAYVFPGGAVDEADRAADLEAICDGRTDAQASHILGVSQGGLAFWVAAIRECFEEAGVLLAYPEAESDGGHVISFRDEAVAARFAAQRDAVNAGRLRLVDLCRMEGLRLDARRIHYFSHWITPLGAPRRYDTRFFVAAAPPEQVPLHDDRETIAHLWVTPAAALEREGRGELEMLLPTIKNLEAISRFNRASDLLAAASAIEHVPAIQPRVVRDSEGVRIVLPGDEGYDGAAEGSLPGGFPLGGARTQGGGSSKSSGSE